MSTKLAGVFREIPVRRFYQEHDDILVVAPNYYWSDDITYEQKNLLLGIKRDYEQWIELLRSVFREATNDISRQIQEADNGFRKWLELRENWSLTADPDQNEAAFQNGISNFSQLITILEASGSSEVIIIPDTNSIVGNPDPLQYGAVAGSDKFTFLLLPTVLSELDDLKNLHRNPDFRDKVNKVVTRIKGWRTQGSLRGGVTVAKSICVRAIAAEPNMKNSLSWLDPENMDDRIVASVLEVQSAHPTDKVILVTGDINLTNKAEAAGICHGEI